MRIGKLFVKSFQQAFVVDYRGVYPFDDDTCDYFVRVGSETIEDHLLTNQDKKTFEYYKAIFMEDAQVQIGLGEVRPLSISLVVTRSSSKLPIHVKKHAWHKFDTDEFKVDGILREFFPAGVRRIVLKKDGIYIETHKMPEGIKI